MSRFASREGTEHPHAGDTVLRCDGEESWPVCLRLVGIVKKKPLHLLRHRWGTIASAADINRPLTQCTGSKERRCNRRAGCNPAPLRSFTAASKSGCD